MKQDCNLIHQNSKDCHPTGVVPPNGFKYTKIDLRMRNGNYGARQTNSGAHQTASLSARSEYGSTHGLNKDNNISRIFIVIAFTSG
jgi:hypothetical protein